MQTTTIPAAVAAAVPPNTLTAALAGTAAAAGGPIPFIQENVGLYLVLGCSVFSILWGVANVFLVSLPPI